MKKKNITQNNLTKMTDFKEKKTYNIEISLKFLLFQEKTQNLKKKNKNKSTYNSNSGSIS